MAALTENIEIPEKVGKLISHPVAVDIIYKGALVKNNAAGYLAPCATEAGATFAGVAYEKKDNSGGSAGDLSCRVIKEGVFLLTGSGLAQSDVGAVVFASDDQTITTSAGANLQPVGRIVAFKSATQVWVKIETAMVPSATVAELGTTSDLTALVVAATTLSDLSTGDSYTDAAVNAIFAEVETALDLKADNADVETLRTEVEARLDNIEAKIDAILGALKASGLMLD